MTIKYFYTFPHEDLQSAAGLVLRRGVTQRGMGDEGTTSSGR
jgi:hypothetical protein